MEWCTLLCACNGHIVHDDVMHGYMIADTFIAMCINRQLQSELVHKCNRKNISMYVFICRYIMYD